MNARCLLSLSCISQAKAIRPSGLLADIPVRDTRSRKDLVLVGNLILNGIRFWVGRLFLLVPILRGTGFRTGGGAANPGRGGL